MDGLKQVSTLEGARTATGRAHQQTLKSPISCVGVGVHSGRRTSVTLRPAEANHGIVFHRTDLNRLIPATYDRVVDTRLSTVIADPEWASARVGTIEHLMAAFAAKGIDNALVEVDGAELPILDGSAAPFLFLLDCAGVEAQAAPRRVIEIRRTVRVTDGTAFAELRPLGAAARAAMPTLDMEVSIDFAAEAIGRQSCRMRLESETFRNEFARARTFAQAHEIDALREAGFALGGSFENAVVVDGAKVLNPGGLRMADEFARHKLVDAVGDLALAGAALHGRFIGHRTGHALNNRLLRTLFAKAATWTQTGAAPIDAVAA
jgi:UDP-3-O-[3-hydroxymyristoyl] N-acetylglucosamine deacetylase